MSVGMQSWLLRLVCAAILGLICTGLAGEDSRPMKLTVGMMLLLVLCVPFSNFDLTDISQLLSKSRLEAQQSVSGIEVQNRELLARIISEQTEAYILDKAKTMDMVLTVEVTVAQGDLYPYPDAVMMAGHTTAAQRRAMNEWIEQNLAIAEENLTWKEAKQ